MRKTLCENLVSYKGCGINETFRVGDREIVNLTYPIGIFNVELDTVRKENVIGFIYHMNIRHEYKNILDDYYRHSLIYHDRHHVLIRLLTLSFLYSQIELAWDLYSYKNNYISKDEYEKAIYESRKFYYDPLVCFCRTDRKGKSPSLFENNENYVLNDIVDNIDSNIYSILMEILLIKEEHFSDSLLFNINDRDVIANVLFSKSNIEEDNNENNKIIIPFSCAHILRFIDGLLECCFDTNVMEMNAMTKLLCTEREDVINIKEKNISDTVKGSDCIEEDTNTDNTSEPTTVTFTSLFNEVSYYLSKNPPIKEYVEENLFNIFNYSSILIDYPHLFKLVDNMYNLLVEEEKHIFNKDACIDIDDKTTKSRIMRDVISLYINEESPNKWLENFEIIRTDDKIVDCIWHITKWLFYGKSNECSGIISYIDENFPFHFDESNYERIIMASGERIMSYRYIIYYSRQIYQRIHEIVDKL